MKVLFFITEYFRDSQTGAGTQIRETVNALMSMGVEVTRIYVSFAPVKFKDVGGKELENTKVAQIVQRHDVVHLIHCSRWLAEVWRSFPKKPSVGSTIYWGGWERVVIAFRTYKKGLSRIKAVLNAIRSMTSSYLDLRGVDVLLPNSYAEAENVKKYARLSPNALFFPVNNGFLKPTFSLSTIERYHRLPKGEYIVVPGICVNRKNQLGLIKALRNSSYQIVFLGGYEENSWYFSQCRKYANERMSFLGYLQHDSLDYWSVLSHARCAVLPSDCETPGIALIEAAYAGARPIVTKFGGTMEYYGFDGEYFDPRSASEILEAVNRGWDRGRLSSVESEAYSRFSWNYCASLTKQAYKLAIQKGAK